LVAPKHLVISFGATKPTAHTEEEDVRKPYILTRLPAPENYAIHKFLFFNSSFIPSGLGKIKLSVLG
jgi:hypothetical protein